MKFLRDFRLFLKKKWKNEKKKKVVFKGEKKNEKKLKIKNSLGIFLYICKKSEKTKKQKKRQF